MYSDTTTDTTIYDRAPDKPLAFLLCRTGARSTALVLGTGIGGLLASPAVHYPNVFSSTGLFAR